MIQIINRAGLIAHLFPNTSISIERNNPLFLDSDSFFEDITYSFNLPADAWNKEFLKSGHLVEAENNVYELSVQTIVSGITFFAGVLRYSFVNPDFKALLKVNYGSLGEKVKNVKVSEIYTRDRYDGGITIAHMKEVCQKPREFAYSFFPIYNEKWNPEKVDGTKNFVNYWDHNAQSFQISGPGTRNISIAAPFWKLKHILIKVLEYLGFECDGSWVNDPESDKIYIYSIKAINTIYDSVLVLPENLTIADFLKIIKDRFNINFNFDLFSGKVQIESGNAILKSTDIIPLSAFTEEIIEINTPDVKGYTITLKPDTTDELFIDLVNPDQNKHVPTNLLIIGDGKTKLEIESSTLKSKTIDDYSFPATQQPLSFSIGDDLSDFPLRFLYYNGMKAVANGKVFPEAKPIELSVEDGNWYRFLNDSKKIKLQLAIPVHVLVNLNPSKKISFHSPEDFYVTAVIEKIDYVLKNKTEERIPTTIECRLISPKVSTAIAVIPTTTALETGTTVSAYFDKETTGLEKIEIDFFFHVVSNSETGAFTDITNAGTLNLSTDKFGVGGSKFYYVNYLGLRNGSYSELRVKSGIPKYGIRGGNKFLFTKKDNYYFSSAGGASDLRGVWIVF